jgi:hypothetical protein
MFEKIRNFSQLPNTLKLTIATVTGGGVIALASLLISNSKYVLLFLGGTAGVVLLIYLFMRLIAIFSKMKATPLLQGLLQNTSSTPKGITDAGKMAQLDDLRKKFEEGLSTFKTAGKSLYDFPWLLIVGEPGSGKTEAIRHCNIGFPPGLQDEFQGAGGTLNMNWWFTDHAVILDTAGRLMFEEVGAGQTSEWKEFLSLLKKFRYNCPINGLFLAIPADSLIKDSADEIEKKASQIARQLDVIQRILDVRFPVFVIITKSDLITGFRDFFFSIDDPQLQHQMFGWSNPAPLDEPFNATFIDQHIKTVKGRLFRKRLALLHKTEAEDNASLTICQKESMFAFPHTLEKLAPRMSLYLERIFSVGNQWSCKPLFFRGIYFTSSMQEGSALDQELADTLGVPVESLPDGRVWARERAYFLRDLFMKKVFAEKGLVSRATNAAKQHTRRKAAVLMALILSVFCMILFTLYGWSHYKNNIKDLDLFVNIRESIPRLIDIDKREYVGDKNFLEPYSKKKYIYFLMVAANKWNEQCKHLWRPFQVVNNIELNKAAQNVYSYSLVNPLIDVACKGLNKDPNNWQNLQINQTEKPNDNVRRLNVLLNICGKKTIDKAKLNELAECTLDAKAIGYIKGIQKDNDSKENLFEMCPGNVGIKNELVNYIRPEVDKSLSYFLKYWSDPNQFAKINILNELIVKLTEYDGIEKDLLNNVDFQTNYELLSKKSVEIEKYLSQNNIETLSKKYDSLLEQAENSVKTAFKAINIPEDVLLENKIRNAEKNVLGELKGYRALRKESSRKWDKLFLERDGKQQQNLLLIRYAVWCDINDIVVKTNSSETQFLDVILDSSWPQDMKDLKSEAEKTEDSHNSRMMDGQRLFITKAFDLIEKKSPKNIGEFEAAVKQKSQQKADASGREGKESIYDSNVYTVFKQKWNNVCTIFTGQSAVSKWPGLQSTINKFVNDYQTRYLEYWGGEYVINKIQDLLDKQAKDALGIQSEDTIHVSANWEQQSVILGNLMPSSTLEQIAAIKEKSIYALKAYNNINMSSPAIEIEGECTADSKMEEMIRKWTKGLSKQNDSGAKLKLKELIPGEFKEYYNYKKESFPDRIWGLYICGLANNTLEALNKTSWNEAHNKMEEYRKITNKYPFNLSSMEDVTKEQIDMMNDLFTKLTDVKTPAIPDESSLRGVQSSEAVTLNIKEKLDRMDESIKANFNKLDKSWDYWCQNEIRDVKTKFDRIPNQCEIWLMKKAVPLSNPVYKYFRIEGAFTDNIQINQYEDKQLGKFPFPWKDVRIVCKKTADSPDEYVLEQRGIWSFMRMFTIKENIKQQEYTKEFSISATGSRETLNLKVVFSRTER